MSLCGCASAASWVVLGASQSWLRRCWPPSRGLPMTAAEHHQRDMETMEGERGEGARRIVMQTAAVARAALGGKKAEESR